MKQENIIQTKSYDFAIKVVNLYRFLSEEKREYVLLNQLLCFGISIGANIEEGIGGQSSKDFFTKLNSTYKDVRESHYELKLLKDTSCLEGEKVYEYRNGFDELFRIMGLTIKTTKIKMGISIPHI